MSAHRPRPRSGQFTFDGHRLKQLHSDPPSSGLPSTPRRSSAPFAPHQSPAALIIDGGGSGGGGACADAREQPQQKKQPNRHRRVVSVSWPGDISLKSQWHDKDDNQRDLEWEQHLQDMSRRSSSTKSSSSSADEEPPVLVGLGLGATAAARPAAVEAGAAAAAAATVNVKVVAPNKRQRQMDYSKTRVSSGPIDIPPSPRTTGDRDEAEGGERGAKAATDAGEWYPCWTPSRPDDNKCGEKGGPPEHILIWERAVKQQRQQQQQQEQQPEEGAGRAEIVEQDEDVEDVGDDSDDDGLQQRRPERRMSSDQPIFDMDL